MWHPFKPEYLWRPRQIVRRLSFRASGEVAPLQLPWECTINALSSEVIGRAIATQGIYDLPLTEAIVRLTDPGDIAIDVGANIGYTALVLSRSAGATGHVLCFEPNPALLSLLTGNARNWKGSGGATIEVRTSGLSDRNGTDVLGFPEGYESNQGLATVGLQNNSVPVQVCRLDSLDVKSAGIMKVDVEGHEPEVFAGAEALLSQKLIRDILFEEHETYPARSHRILLSHGYEVFRIARSTWKPLLLQPESPARHRFLPANYLGTTDPVRAKSRFAELGWRALSAHPFRGNRAKS